MVTITLDPGHGGEDPGAVGRGGSYEKHVTLAVAKRLKAKIDAEPNMRAVLTRDTDFFVPLHMRVQKARRIQSDLFCFDSRRCFHTDANGSSVFALSEMWRVQFSRALSGAERKLGRLDRRRQYRSQGSDAGAYAARPSQTATISDSLKLGKAVLNEISGINRLHKESVEQAGFAVLKAPDIPSILIETAFISNPEEERKPMTPIRTRWQRRLFQGYASTLPKIRPWRSLGWPGWISFESVERKARQKPGFHMVPLAESNWRPFALRMHHYTKKGDRNK